MEDTVNRHTIEVADPKGYEGKSLKEFKVGDLIDILKTLPRSAKVTLQSDGEGNNEGGLIAVDVAKNEVVLVPNF